MGYRASLDGLRALAIAPVVAVHAFEWPQRGSLGVDLFFVLSGFLITVLLLDERLRSGSVSITSFYRRRAARLMPALLCMLLVYAIVAGGSHMLAVVFAATYSSNIASAIDPNAVPFALGHLWSLAQEEQFYLVWPILLTLLTIRVRPGLLLAALSTLLVAVLVEKVVLINAGAPWQRLYYGPDMHADPLLVGCLFGTLFALGRAPRVPFPLGVITLVAVAISPTFALFDVGGLARTAYAFAGGVLILACLSEGSLERLLAAPPLVFLGRISYSLYLWHVPVLVAAWHVRDDYWMSALAVAVAVLIATTSFVAVERPLRRRLSGRTSSARGLAVPAVSAT